MTNGGMMSSETGREAMERATLAAIARIQEDAVLFAGASSWRGEWVMRISVSSATTLEDADVTADAIAAAWAKVSARLS